VLTHFSILSHMTKKLLSLGVFVLSASFIFGQDLSSFSAFKGDTLDGFDFKSSYQEALASRLHGTEVKSFMTRKQCDYVTAKYHLPKKKSAIIPTILTSACNNVDFENGTFTGWVCAVGYNQASTAPLFITNPGPTPTTMGANSPEPSCSYHTLVSTGTDPYSGLPMVDPGGGTWACRLGGEFVNVASAGGFGGACISGGPGQNGSGGETVQQTFIVSSSNAQFTYKYQVVMDQVNHNAGQQPYFRVEVLDSNGHITSPCQQYYVEADTTGSAPAGFLTSNQNDNGGNQVAYCTWTSNALNLSNYIGHPVTVRFTATGCTFSAHFCYAYIDCSCGPVSTVPTHPNICQGQHDTLIAPGSGGQGTYLWTTLPSGTAGIVGSNTRDTVIINASGTYEVNVTYPNGCHYKIDTTITFNALPVIAATTTNVTCHGANNGIATANITSGTGPYTYSWTPGPVGGATTATATGLTAGVTYTVNVKGSGGCTSSSTVQVTQPAVLVAPNTHTNVLCHGGNNGSGNVIPSGGTLSYTYSWTPAGGAASSASGLTAGIYTCLVTDQHGCTTHSFDTISEPAALATTNTATKVLCHGTSTGSDTMMVTGGIPAYTFAWTPINTTGPKATGLPAGTYTCTIMDAHNCMITTTALITEPPMMVLTPHSRPTPCAGVVGAASVTVVGGTGAYTYSWAAPSVSTIDSITALAAGIYQVTVKDSNGCTKISNIAVNNTNGPHDTVLHSTQVKCFGGTNGAATVKGTGGTGTLTYSWSPNAFTGLTDTAATGLSAGVYLITVIDGAGCKSTTSDTLIQPAQVTATAAITNVLCNGQHNGQAVLTTSGGHPGYTYTWSPVGGNTSTGLALPAGVVTCTIADTNACPGLVTLTITQPALLASHDTTIAATCFGMPNGSASVNPIGGTLGYTYSWSAAGGYTPGASGLVAGIYTCVIVDAHGCIHNSLDTVRQPTVINPTNTTIGTLCNGNSNGTATAVGFGGNAGGYTYSWHPTGGSTATTIGLPAGTYTCTVTDTKGCSGSTLATITQPTALVANNTPKEIACNGQTNGSIIANPNGGTPAYTYSWSPSGGLADTAKNLGPNTYTCTITDGHGCVTTTVAVLTQPSVLKDSINPLMLNCHGDVNGRDTAKVTGGTGPYMYAWTPGGNNTSAMSGMSAQAYTCTVTDAHGCVQVTSLTVTQPSALFGTSSTTDAICTANVGSASVTPSGGTGPYQYSWGAPGSLTSVMSGLYAGNYSCTLIDAKGCSIVIPATVGHHNTTVWAHFNPSALTGVAPVDIHFTDASTGSAPLATWLWDFGNGGGALGGPTVKDTSDYFTDPGTYTVTETVTDAFGCKNDTSIVIHIKERPSSLTVPNVFTPNGDGSNDFFKVKYFGINAYDLKIYDRWGVLMCHFTKPWLEWDGLDFSGGKANDGTYYYVISATGDDQVQYGLNGFLQLIR
jgi:gliding motility-associated-like protein